MVVYWDSQARKQLEGIYYYHRQTAGFRVAERIRKEIRKRAIQLGRFPFLGSIEGDKFQEDPDCYRSLVVEKNYKIIYQTDDKYVYITAIWDTRQNPSRLKEILE